MIAVNLCWLVPGVVGGSEQYLTRLLWGLVELPGGTGGLDVEVFGLPALADAHPDLTRHFPFHAAPVSGASKPLRVAIEGTWLARQTRAADLVHHGGGVVPARSGPAVVTVHDLQYRSFPEYFTAVKLAWLKVQTPRTIRRARLVLVPSEYVKGTIVDAFDADPATIRVVPHGLPEREAVVPPGDEAVAGVRARYGLRRPYALWPAITYPHKGHRALVDAVGRVDGLDLVLTGGVGSAEADAQGPGVHRLGRVPTADLEALYAGAAVVAVPSRYEGFGAPALEAMRRGVPVVASATTALPEVVGDAGVLVDDPTDPAAWATALALVVGDGQVAADLRARGLARAGRFTAAAAAGSLLSAYRDALDPV